MVGIFVSFVRVNDSEKGGFDTYVRTTEARVATFDASLRKAFADDGVERTDRGKSRADVRLAYAEGGLDGEEHGIEDRDVGVGHSDVRVARASGA